MPRAGSSRRSTARSGAQPGSALELRRHGTRRLPRRAGQCADTRLHLDLEGSAIPTAARPRSPTKRARLFLRTLEAPVGREQVGRLFALLVRPPRLPAGDFGVVSRRFAPESGQGRQGARAEAEARPLGLSSPAFRPTWSRPDPAAFAAVDEAVSALSPRRTPAPDAFGGWTTDERLRFLNTLPRKLPTARLEALNAASTSTKPATTKCVRVARSGGRQPLRSGGARSGAIPDHAGPRASS